MLDNFQQLVQRYRRKGLLVDSNILLLHFVGAHDPSLISTFKRTKVFTADDFELLQNVMVRFQPIVTTPNILTEVNGFLNQLQEKQRSACLSMFGTTLARFDEHHRSSDELVQLDSFLKLGLTDTGILDLAKDRYLVLSDDFRLTQILGARGVDAINFNHLRANSFPA